MLKTGTGQIVLFPSSGTGGWEAAIANTLSPGDRVLHRTQRDVSRRVGSGCARISGLDVTVIEVPWGEGLPADRYEEALAADTAHEIKALLATHNETATGVLSDIGGHRAGAEDHGAPGALSRRRGEVPSAAWISGWTKWGVDVVVNRPRRRASCCLAGLAIVVRFGKGAGRLRDREAAALVLSTSARWRRPTSVNGYPYTPAVGLMNGLQARHREDAAARGARQRLRPANRRIAEGVRAAAGAWGLDLCAVRPEVYSDSVSAVRTPGGVQRRPEIVARAS